MKRVLYSISGFETFTSTLDKKNIFLLHRYENDYVHSFKVLINKGPLYLWGLCILADCWKEAKKHPTMSSVALFRELRSPVACSWNSFELESKEIQSE